MNHCQMCGKKIRGGKQDYCGPCRKDSEKIFSQTDSVGKNLQAAIDSYRERVIDELERMQQAEADRFDEYIDALERVLNKFCGCHGKPVGDCPAQV